MYISRVEMDRYNRPKMKQLNHLGAFHSWVEESFPEEIEKKTRSRKLWRIDSLNGKEYLLIISESKPSLEKMERFGIEGTAQTKDYTPFLERLEEGQELRFRLKANPTKALSQEGKRGRVVPLSKDEDLMEYLMERAEKNGFSLQLEDFLIVEKGYEEFSKAGQRKIKLRKAVYEGKLTITNIEDFRNTLIHGLGKKKAYGFGLMTVIPSR
ncbi:type I-E CRISPR-associated protein Cas6/Cse3/CasE [Peptoniphilus sp. KCTC 25270]|uniref:type I-E CRISPR-associated protein Cas6/Cse3/CasE n=1 Tax=Peptoniphilus sp. KCTC 25270 TaxID=2897414 RepID=UPI001E490758|nr:type I-E CRISPR-associated protein Cas6/Cse3/CasE [Peptoniphilus sp. KCTC 25270]MCD1147298.1 type I-E CRISPR-associated protein Cas6/Cse3/CasE [Peptoniphilus sp. KCTC 25270]